MQSHKSPHFVPIDSIVCLNILCKHLRLRSDCTKVQSDLRLKCSHYAHYAISTIFAVPTHIEIDDVGPSARKWSLLFVLREDSIHLVSYAGALIRRIFKREPLRPAL